MAEHLVAVFKTAIDAIITINEKGIVEMINPSAEKLFGYSAEEVLGKNITLLMPSPHREEHDSYISRYLETRQPKIIGIGREVNGQRKDGSLFPARLAVSESVIKGRTIFTGIIHDLTPMKEAERKIRLLNEQLEMKVEQRTRELETVVNRLLESNQQLTYEIEERRIIEAALQASEKELKTALEKEKELNALKSRFVTMASHEFRTPLSAILSSADLIEAYTKDSPEDKRMKHVGRIKSAVNSLTNILNDFLSLSKLEENMVKVQPVSFSLRDFCHEFLDEMKGLLKPGQQLVHPAGIPEKEIVLDKKVLKNILYNLVSNAIKYSGEGKEIQCHISLVNHHLTIRITDFGIGIPEEDQPHLFTRFFRAHNAENIQGTGLGLNIVKRYLDLLDGEITYTSKQGEGTTFSVSIPLEGDPS